MCPLSKLIWFFDANSRVSSHGNLMMLDAATMTPTMMTTAVVAAAVVVAVCTSRWIGVATAPTEDKVNKRLIMTSCSF